MVSLHFNSGDFCTPIEKRSSRLLLFVTVPFSERISIFHISTYSTSFQNSKRRRALHNGTDIYRKHLLFYSKTKRNVIF